MARAAVLIVLFGLPAPYVAGQSTDVTLDRYGSVGVSDAEVRQITDLVTHTGKRPWLMRSEYDAGTGRPVARLFLETDVVSPDILRGRMFTLAADEPPSGIRSWKITGTYSYARITTPDIRADDLRGPAELGLPFIVQGDFDDETLIGIVTFIRTEPPIPGASENAGKRFVARASISSIQREADVITVTLRTTDATFERVWVARKDGQWVITKFDWWIV